MPTKEIITKETIKAELLHTQKANIFIHIVAFIFSVIIFSFGIFMSVISDGIGSIILSSMSSLIFAITVFNTCIYFYTWYKISAGKFQIVEDTLNYLCEEDNYRYKYVKIEKVLYFHKYGKYILDNLDGSVFEYASKGDEFYLVLLGKNSKARIYSKKLYEYKE